ncbi:MAG TPA: hypothetical protein PKY82_05590 [Pyrinomonadaceae bacterium]|nr:hypothetical protein [Pyrinomonadaceae bacterium]
MLIVGLMIGNLQVIEDNDIDFQLDYYVAIFNGSKSMANFPIVALWATTISLSSTAKTNF